MRHLDRADEAAYKAYRLDVKRRLLSDCADEISAAMATACEEEELERESPEGLAVGKGARKVFLEARYREVEAGYDAALRRL